jgi:hypothetical protein
VLSFQANLPKASGFKGTPGYDFGEGRCLSMLESIYGLVQAPCQYYMLCREVCQKAGMKQLQTDECVFTCYVSNIIEQSSLTNEDLLVKNLRSLATKMVTLTCNMKESSIGFYQFAYL